VLTLAAFATRTVAGAISRLLSFIESNVTVPSRAELEAVRRDDRYRAGGIEVAMVVCAHSFP